MNDFFFDLQRFANDEWGYDTTNSVYTYTDTSSGRTATCTVLPSSITEENKNNPFGDGMTLSASGSVTFTCDDTSYTMTLNGTATVAFNDENTIKLNITSGTVTDLTYKDGSKSNPVPFILLGGNYYSESYSNQSITISEIGPELKFAGVDAIFKVTTTLNGSSLNVNYKRGQYNKDNHYFDVKFGNFSYKIPISDWDAHDRYMIFDSSTGMVSIPITSSDTNTSTYEYTDGDTTITESYTAGDNSTIYLSNGADGFYLSNLNQGETFTVTKTKTNGTSTTTTEIKYTMYNQTLIAEIGIKDQEGYEIKRWNGYPITSGTYVSREDLDFDSSDALLGDIYEISDKTLTVSSTVLSGFSTTGERKLIVDDTYKDNSYFDSDGKTPNFGTLVKTGNGVFTLEKNDASFGENFQLTSIVIEDGLTAIIDNDFDIPITVTNAHATFTSTDGNEFISVTADSSNIVSIGGSTYISLNTGTLRTAGTIDESLNAVDQTIVSSNYTLSGYGDSLASESERNDGVTFSTTGVVGDVDNYEYFQLNTASKSSNYTLLPAGLLEKTKDDATDIYLLHRDVKKTSTDRVGIDINFSTLDDGELIILPDNKILEIGTTNTRDAVVYNSKENPETGYAALAADNGKYTLSPIDTTVAFTDAVSTISLTGGETKISQSLAGSDITIATRNSQTTFRVTKSGTGGTFTVNSGTLAAPTITDAEEITLLTGSITATGSQKITLGDDGKVITFSNLSAGVTVTSNSITFDSGVTGSFIYDGKFYQVDGGNGMTFALNDDVTIGALSSDDNDVFSYGNSSTNAIQYSIKGAGFVKGESSNASLLANTANSVVASSLTATTADWKALTTVDSVNSVTLIADPVTSTLIDNAFSTTYGSLEKKDGVHNLTRTANDEGSLSNISLASGVNALSLSGVTNYDFLNVSIIAPNTATFKVTGDTDGDNAYQVTLSGANTSISGASSAELISGSLRSDNAITVTTGGKPFIAGEVVTLVTDSSDSSIAGISKNETFNLSQTNYSLKGAGLLSGTDNKLLRGSKPSTDDNVTSTIKFSDIASTNWLNMISASPILAINSGIGESRFVVNDTASPDSLYGELIPGENGYSLTNGTGYDEWDKANTININNTTVTLSNHFAEASLAGSLSGAAFTIESLSGTSFIVTDKSSGGAILSDIKAINQTAGLIGESGINSIAVGNNTIYSSVSSGLPLAVSVSGGMATLSSLDSGETFNINTGTKTIAYSINSLGIMTDTDQLLKASSSIASARSSAALSDLIDLDSDKWIYIASIADNNIFNIPPTVGGDSASEWLVMNTGKTTQYAKLTKSGDVYTIVKDGDDWGTGTIYIGDNKTLSLSSDFSGKNISVESSKAAFQVSVSGAYTDGGHSCH